MSDIQYCRCNRCRDLRHNNICPQCRSNLGTKGNNAKMEVSPSNTNTFNPIFNPSITINVSTGHVPGHIGVETFQYIALAEEDKRIYTNEDALQQYGSSNILNPNSVSNVNLFVNGVLQPPSIYDLKEGTLTLESEDLPPKDAPIILLFVLVKG